MPPVQVIYTRRAPGAGDRMSALVLEVRSCAKKLRKQIEQRRRENAHPGEVARLEGKLARWVQIGETLCEVQDYLDNKRETIEL